jgi:hypothetical protein
MKILWSMFFAIFRTLFLSKSIWSAEDRATNKGYFDDSK